MFGGVSMNKEQEFQKIAEQLDAIECPSFALWYLLQEFPKIVDRQMTKGTCENKTYEALAQIKYAELKKAAEEMRDIIAADLW